MNPDNLKSLEDAYEITAEVPAASDRERCWLGRRRETGDEVVITVFHAVEDDNNALGHLASDVNLLIEDPHPSLLRIVEGRWLGKDFAIVRERLDVATLDEVLARDGHLPNTRAATILHEVNALLEWARIKGIVHRGVTPHTVYLVGGNDRVLMSLAPTPIGIEGIPDETADTRTIGALAWSMLVGKPYAERAEDEEIGSLRPDLARQVVSEVDAVVAAKRGGEPVDLARFISMIAMGDALLQGEVERTRVEAEMEEAHRAQIAKCEAENLLMEQKALEHADRLASEQKKFEKEVEEAHAKLERERERLEKQRQLIEARLAEAEAERARVAELRQFEAERARLMNPSDLDGDDDVELEVEIDDDPDAETAVAAIAAAEAADMEDDLSQAPLEPRRPIQPTDPIEPIERPVVVNATTTTTTRPARPKWAMPAIAAAVVLLFLAALAGSGILSRGSKKGVATNPDTTIYGSAGGNVESPMSQQYPTPYGPQYQTTPPPPQNPPTYGSPYPSTYPSYGGTYPPSSTYPSYSPPPTYTSPPPTTYTPPTYPTTTVDSTRPATREPVQRTPPVETRPDSVTRTVNDRVDSIKKTIFMPLDSFIKRDSIRAAEAKARADSVQREKLKIDSMIKPKPDTTIRPRPDTTRVAY